MQQPPNRKASAVFVFTDDQHTIQYDEEQVEQHIQYIYMLIAPAFYLILSAAGWCCMLRYMMITCRKTYAAVTPAPI